MTERIKSAIERSISHTEIVHIDGCPEDIRCLLSEADDSVEAQTDGGPLYEAWGIDDDGNNWRVHARPDGNISARRVT